MSEHDFEPIPDPDPAASVAASQFIAAFTLLDQLLAVGGLSENGLKFARSALRTGDWHAAAWPARVRPRHTLTLDEIARQLRLLDPEMAPYYARDRLEAAPDDASGMAL